MTRRVLWSSVAVVGVLAVGVAAQEPRSSFEVTSVKRNVSATRSGGIPIARPGGAFQATNATLLRMLQFAYELDDYRIVGGPNWVREDRFDVMARASGEVPIAELRLMVQSLLKDRFTLVVHREPRTMPVYALVLARGDRRLGPGMQQNDEACAQRKAEVTESRTPNGGIAARYTCTTIAELTSRLSSTVKMPVFDRTALTGMWDYELSFTGESRAGAGAASVARDPNDAPALFTALQEQLWLKLDRQEGLVDMLVIDDVRQPTEN